MIPAITPANHKHSCCMQEWVGLGAVCIISSLLKRLFVQRASSFKLERSDWREVSLWGGSCLLRCYAPVEDLKSADDVFQRDHCGAVEK